MALNASHTWMYLLWSSIRDFSEPPYSFGNISFGTCLYNDSRLSWTYTYNIIIMQCMISKTEFSFFQPFAPFLHWIVFFKISIRLLEYVARASFLATPYSTINFVKCAVTRFGCLYKMNWLYTTSQHKYRRS